MWTYEYAPAAYFTDTYGFEADGAWFDRVRLSVLRVPGCSASFVSPNGLVATNHHCVRGRVPAVQRPGERLLDDGFFAKSLEEERRIPGYYADRLIAVEDVSDEVLSAVDAAATDAGRREARARAAAAIQERLGARHGDVTVQVVPLYHGGRYSAYVFRRFTDVRLVAAVELRRGSSAATRTTSRIRGMRWISRSCVCMRMASRTGRSTSSRGVRRAWKPAMSSS
jgi:hypothetical protein